MVGQGRKTVVGQNPLAMSRLKFPCKVCEKEFRSDKLTEHYRNTVEFDSEGNPLSKFSKQFSQLNQSKKEHTLFFLDNGFTQKKMPNYKAGEGTSVKTNPFTAAKLAHATKKQKTGNMESRTVSSDAEPGEGTSTAVEDDSTLNEVAVHPDDDLLSVSDLEDNQENESIPLHDDDVIPLEFSLSNIAP